MNDPNKTMEQLEHELAKARRRISELEVAETERKQAEETLWQSEKRFRSIAETATDAIIIFDTRENIFFWNQAAQDIFGYSAGETRGHLLVSILTSQYHDRLRTEMEQVIATGEANLIGKTIEVIGIRKNGQEFPLELSLATWKTKEEIFFTAIGRDISERKQAEEALQQAYQEIEKRVEERTSELQHEIAERERLQQEVIEAQQATLRELSSPIIPVMDRIIVVPLIGSVDSMRARDITRALLAGIRENRAKVVILDITGVPIVDSGVADHLNKTIQAARLKGAHTIVTGVSDAVAETIVDLGIDWTSIETLSNLQMGLRTALARMGQRIEG